ncbi:MAG: hypothetical protein B6244_08305 [Candidatus Cloacimonetes bacterium 4572_55]|nr:MAG: hypothetical protein B6244_08305 [Candidatus Cloacimonetes bacterium 4572_55]
MSPIFKMCLAFTLGMLTAPIFSLSADWLFLTQGLILSFIFLFSLIPKFQRLTGLFCWVLILIFGATWYELHSLENYLDRCMLLPSDHIGFYAELDLSRVLEPEEKVKISGLIIDDPEVSLHNTRFLTRVDTLYIRGAGFPVSGTVQVTIQTPTTRLQVGDVITANGELFKPDFARNPGTFDYRTMIEHKKIDALLTAKRSGYIRRIGRQPPSFFQEKIILPLRMHVIRCIYAGGGAIDINPPIGFLKAMLLGEKSNISDDVKNAFSNTGTIHILAISGMHVGMIVMLFLWLWASCDIRYSPIFRLLMDKTIVFFSDKSEESEELEGPSIIIFPEPISFTERVKKISEFMPITISCIILLVVFSNLTGSLPPVIRASIMVSIGMLASLFKRKITIPFVYNALAIAALTILIFLSPRNIFYIGFQLSFGATLSILYFTPLLMSWVPKFLKSSEKGSEGFLVKLRDWTIGLFVVSIAAQIGLAPIIITNFGRIALISPFANLIVVPLLTISLGFAFLAILLTFINPVFASLFMGLNYLVTHALLKIVAWMSLIPFSTTRMPAPDFIEIILYFFLIITALKMKTSVRARKWAIIFFLIFMSKLTWNQILEQENKHLGLTFLDVGASDIAFVESPNGRWLLMDSGSLSGDVDNRYKRVVAPFIRYSLIDQIDFLILSGSDDPHERLTELLSYVHVERVALIGRPPDEIYRQFLLLLQEKGIAYSPVSRNDRIVGFDPLEIEIVNGDNLSSEPSLWVRVSYEGTVCMLTSGSTPDFLSNPSAPTRTDLRCHILKMGNQTPRLLDIEKVVEATNPRIVYVPMEKNCEEAGLTSDMKRIFRLNRTRVYSSDDCGALTITVAEGRINACSMISP